MSTISTDNNAQVKAGTLTVLYILALLSLFFLITLKAPEPPEEGGGLLVDFGTTETGFGEEEPNPAETTPIENTATPSPATNPVTSTEEVMTQNIEESIALPEKKKEIKNPQPAVTENNTEVKNPTTAETPTTKVDERKPNQRALFTGFGNKNSSSEGNTKGPGNMGVKDGGESPIYAGKNTGIGLGGDGSGRIGTGLIGRKLNSIPEIKDATNKTGIVIIKVKVDQNGKVVTANYTPSGSTISDQDLITKCQNAASKAKFSTSDEKDIDYGTLIFRFEVR